jgi:hypothetical protein
MEKLVLFDYLTPKQKEGFIKKYSSKNIKHDSQLRNERARVSNHAEDLRIDEEQPDMQQLPYGLTLLPITDQQGDAVMIFKQPGEKDRLDILIVEKKTNLQVDVSALKRCRDPRTGHYGEERLRVRMDKIIYNADSQPDSVAMLRIGTELNSNSLIDDKTLSLLAEMRYSFRTSDADGWFEFGDDAFPKSIFRHGFPDIATREQGEKGIRGPSIPSINQSRIKPELFTPKRDLPLDPGERVIYELHVGTFTSEGSFSGMV